MSGHVTSILLLVGKMLVIFMDNIIVYSCTGMLFNKMTKKF